MRNTYTQIIIFVQLLFLVGCQKNIPDKNISKDEYLVYQNIINESCKSNFSMFRVKPKYLVALDSTIQGRIYAMGSKYDNEIKDWLMKSIAEKYPKYNAYEIASSYDNQNKYRYKLSTDSILTSLKCKPLKDSLMYYWFIDRSGPHENYERFYKEFPNACGLVMLSRVGFNYKHTQAIVYYEHWFDMLAVYGYYILLEKIDGEWRQIDKWCTILA